MTENTVIGREPIEVIEIDQDFCSLSYGVSPCTAVLADGGRKCYNTLTTCQDVTNFTKSTLTLRFISNRVSIPQDSNKYFPFLESVRVSPGMINPGGGNQSLSPLGKRATISVTLGDYPSNDIVVDPYLDERISGAAQADGIGYDPFERSTFWAKWRARNRYYTNRVMRYISGYLKDGQIVDAVTRTFVITGFNGPTASDKVTITGKDILTKAQDEKAKAPSFSSGRLSSAITDVQTSITISPADEYPVSGYIRIADEVMSYTRSGTTFTVSRAQFNTEAKAHDEGDRAQWCLQYSSARPDDIVNDLLATYSGIDSSYLDTAGWAAEVDSFMPRRYNALITEPTGVQQLLGEMCEQMYFYIWFDERNDLVKMRAVRPAEDETIYQLTDNRHLVQDSINISDATDQLITRVIINYALINPARDLNEPSNYAATEIVLSDEETADRLDDVRTKVIYSRWLSAADGAAAIDIGNKLLARYSTVPRKVSFSLDAKDRDVWVGDFCQVTHRRAVDDTGIAQPVNIQVMTASESQPGTTFSYSGQEFVFETPPDPTERIIIISGNLENINLRTLHDDRFAPPVGDESVTVIIRNGIVIGSASTSLPAVETGTWPTGVSLNLFVEGGGIIGGKGGVGGRGGNNPPSGASLMNGSSGGPAIDASDYPLSINNLGIIGGGGGGGGGGATGKYQDPVRTLVCTGGGAGGGSLIGSAGANGGSGSGGTLVISASDGSAGPNNEGTDFLGTVYGGNGGNGERRDFAGGNSVFGGFGGRGGGLGVDGEIGGDPIVLGGASSTYLTTILAAGSGGPAGPAVVGASNVTWVNKGDVRGAEIA